MSPDTIGRICLYVAVAIFLGWMVWVTWPSHPERIQKLQKKLGIVPPQNQDLSNDRNKPPRSDQE